MADAGFRTVRSTTPTSSGTQDFTVTGIGTPKAALIVVWGTLTSDGTATNHSRASFGITDGTSHFVASLVNQNAQAATNTARYFSTAKVVALHNAATSTLDCEADFSAWITDGIRINWTNPAANALVIDVTLWYGDDVQAKVGNTRPNDNGGTPGNNPTTVSTVFQPQHLFTLSDLSDGAVGGSIIADAKIAIGVAAGSTSAVASKSLSLIQLDNLADSAPCAVTSDALAQPFTAGTAPFTMGASADLVAFTASGFTISSGAVSGRGPLFGYLAINYGAKRLVSLTSAVTSGSTGTHALAVGAVVESALLLASYVSSATAWGGGSRTSYDSAMAGVLALGFAGDTVQGCGSVADEDAQATTDTESLASASALDVQADTGAASYDATYAGRTTVSSDPTYVQFTWNAVDGTTPRRFIVLALSVLQVTATGAGTFPLPTGAGTGSEAIQGSGAGTFPLPTGSGAGSEAITGSGAGSFPLPTGAGAGQEAIGGVGAGTFPLTQGAGAGTLSIVGAGAGSFPLPEAEGSGTQPVTGSGAGFFPLPLGGPEPVLGFCPTELEGTYSIVSELGGSYDLVTELEGSVCVAVVNQKDSMFAGNLHVLDWLALTGDDGEIIDLDGKVVKFALTRLNTAGDPLLDPILAFSSDDVSPQVTIPNPTPTAPTTGDPHVRVRIEEGDTVPLNRSKAVVYYGELEVFEDAEDENPIVVATVLLTIKPNVRNVVAA